jgi:predicted hydrocarbon binding protein
VADLAFVVLPLQSKLRIGLHAFARIFTQLSDQLTTVEEKDNEFVWTILKCPCCWGRTGADKPVCFISTGLLQESLKWVSGGNEFRVNESRCVAIGDEVCEFIIQKEPLG